MGKNQVTLITGASSGIGCELAKVFAQSQHDLVLVARRVDVLQELAVELSKEHNIRVYVIGMDLSEGGAAAKVYDRVKELNLEVDILVNNAGFGYVGLFHEEEQQKDTDMLQVNISALTELTKLFGREMAKRKEGRILNVASTGSYHPGPYTAVYYATKAYVLSFSEAIAEELRPFNVSVTALCPGATKTNFAKRAGRRDNCAAMEPKLVAKAAYKALMKKKSVVVPGLANKLLVILPRRLVKGMVGKYQKRLSNR
ncbi:SDR family NAD(P)-dependent oxidoreductase [Clostridium thermarum]|uniref:SDR family NAD(P)-dependent oxidoreductase n=1 Tax=Clostridium thermarum TaxID=1716543 RepID=UPI00111F4F0C|nr:SDR family oxidoreductase [Clostridium thermarum]